jgi:hypothetical protein
MRVAVGVISLVGMAFAGACTEPSCKETDTLYTASSDVTPTGSPAVARVEVAQTFKTYGPVGCSGEPLEAVGIVTGTVTNTSATPMTLGFSVQGLNAQGTPVWAFPDTASLTIDAFQPGQTVDLGQMKITTQKLSAGIRTVVTAYLPSP